MLRILIALLAVSLLPAGWAWADDDDFGGTDVIDATDAPDYEEPVEYEYVPAPAGEPVPLDAGQMGMYFGAGDEFISGYTYSDGMHYTMHNHDGQGGEEGYSYHDEQIYYPGYYHEPGYSTDNVYGPMWGVPADASGLDSYQAEYYHHNPGADPEWTPAEAQHVHDSDGGDDDSGDYQDGLEITGGDDW